MPFNYKNPISPEQLNGVQSVKRSDTQGTNFSILGVGGFVEVYNLTDLIYTIPSGTTGPIRYSGNSIPITFTKGTGAAFSPDVLTLNSDNISSGRRRLGMLAYVKEVDQVYQFDIINFETLWNAATGATGIGGNTVVFSDFGTTVSNNSVAGQNFINAWTGTSIEGYLGVTRPNSNWKKFWANNLAITGGTYNAFTSTLNLVNITGGTVPITGIGGGGGGGTTLTGGTYSQSTLELNLNSSAGTITIFGVTGLYITGGTYTSGTSTLDLFNSTGGTIPITGITAGSGGSSYFTGLTQVTESVRTGLTPSIGYMVYQTDASDGVYVYKASGWIQMI
jgi:hypothetical protein